MSIDMMSAILQTLLVGVIAFIVMTLVVSYVKYERLHEAARRGAGILTPRDAFLLQLADLLGVGRRTPSFLVILLQPVDEPIEGLPEVVRRYLRKTDTVCPLGEGRVGMICHASVEHAARLLDRLRAALVGDWPARKFSFRWAAFPQHGESASELLAAAEADLGSQEPLAVGTGRDSTPEDAPLDPLTGVLRPEQVDLAVHKYVARCRREGRPVSLLYIDVADLESINQRHGPETGDAVLKNLAELLQRNLREDDLIGRLGDDDFLVAAACAPSEATIPAGRVIEAVRAATIRVGLGAIHYAVRIGIAGYPDHGGSPRALFMAAEMALAAARRKGLNQAVVFDPSMRPHVAAAVGPRDRL